MTQAIAMGTMKAMKRASTIALAVICLSGMFRPAFSYGAMPQDRWKPAHLEHLPAGIRAIAQKWQAVCGGSIAAAQQFALYLAIPGGELVALHFDEFRCGKQSAQCSAKGCLHEVYLATKGQYRRVLSVHARDIRLLRDQNAALVEISAVNGEVSALRWDGRRFVE